MSREIKVHLIVSEGGGSIRTACGREAFACRGFDPRPNEPGEYDTSVCDRIHATPYEDDVTCKRCRP